MMVTKTPTALEPLVEVEDPLTQLDIQALGYSMTIGGATTTMVEPNLREIHLNILKATEGRLWTSSSPSRGL
jgi:hypothetical protein